METHPLDTAEANSSRLTAAFALSWATLSTVWCGRTVKDDHHGPDRAEAPAAGRRR